MPALNCVELEHATPHRLIPACRDQWHPRGFNNELHETTCWLILKSDCDDALEEFFRIAPEGRCDFSPAIYGWVDGMVAELVPEGRLTSYLSTYSVVPPGLNQV